MIKPISVGPFKVHLTKAKNKSLTYYAVVDDISLAFEIKGETIPQLPVQAFSRKKAIAILRKGYAKGAILIKEDTT